MAIVLLCLLLAMRLQWSSSFVPCASLEDGGDSVECPLSPPRVELLCTALVALFLVLRFAGPMSPGSSLDLRACDQPLGRARLMYAACFVCLWMVRWCGVLLKLPVPVPSTGLPRSFSALVSHVRALVERGWEWVMK